MLDTSPVSDADIEVKSSPILELTGVSSFEYRHIVTVNSVF